MSYRTYFKKAATLIKFFDVTMWCSPKRRLLGKMLKTFSKSLQLFLNTIGTTKTEYSFPTHVGVKRDFRDVIFFSVMTGTHSLLFFRVNAVLLLIL